MFTSVLIANRGEIALRIIRTCKKLGVRTVAVYSEADRNALHVKMADECYEIGPSRVQDSYLNMDKILEAAKVFEVDAIHPGYGLLSENAEFARRCEQENIVFIGPQPNMIELMGEKVKARKAMAEAGFPIIPGTDFATEKLEEMLQAAKQIGFPVMVKASAGGGGIGMQVVQNENELEKAFVSNQKRAKMFFGNGEMFVEKAIEQARHIEIQILADNKGNTVHLWERECSIQRRHQKVIEESPSPILDEELRDRIGTLARDVAQKIGYTNAGTIECLVDHEKQIYFLEMNTRLQVEHPVTEEITGIDLVEWQLRIASGETLPFKQKDLKRDGHAMEVRIYAEDPKTSFPSPGTITAIHVPMMEGVRHECAVEKGSVITPFYDPMIAKMITKGKTRKEALDQLIHALQQYQIEGIKTNIPMLLEVLSHPAFQAGNITTSFVSDFIQTKKG
ncbi:acetyl-CoA carboxylase biotin carboxylase subunit [Alkalihalobacillus sp. MEB130]|uniref:acetyl-CoA carboxylase biotin carboxylase subunit n=1 Tax=Alkalihalobacillus sp. MEB130 TaxID=2976704 RepID=UPI0028DD62EE|nr:acetyl-CoA carboxylase biotin carboxylase subunit [Alkalihalobacillus sp. MEB130]MDT8862051.1 acetyl-CoA carboxylase biotin carboxylase subunit [Alkalihalobacillus sp. MEB130]